MPAPSVFAPTKAIGMPLSSLKNVLHLEEQPLIALDVAVTLSDAGVAHVIHVTTCDAALDVVNEQQIDAAILDVSAAGVGTDRVARRLRIAGIPYVLYTGAATIPDQLTGGERVLTKPVDSEELIAAMRRTLGLTPHQGGAAGGTVGDGSRSADV
jgi:DNA-binding response OmpR family regulator